MEDQSSKKRKIVPFSRAKTSRVLVEAGGPVDEVSVTIAIFGEDLEPQEISRALGVEPTSAHRRGERRAPRSRPYPSGAWLLEERGVESAEMVIDRLLRRLTQDPEIWRDVKMRHGIQVRFTLHMTGWNKGFSIPLEQVTRIASLGASIEFDIFAYGVDA